jgi:nucleotide-binding universal stress UspA family protein
MTGALVVGYDGTDGARAAIREAARLAPLLQAPVVAAFAFGTSPLGGEVADLSSSVRERGEAVLSEAAELLRGAGVETRTELVDDKPAEALVELADREDAQMIIVGSYGERPLRGVLLGSTPHKLVHLSQRPVLVVRG